MYLKLVYEFIIRFSQSIGASAKCIDWRRTKPDKMKYLRGKFNEYRCCVSTPEEIRVLRM